MAILPLRMIDPIYKALVLLIAVAAASCNTQYFVLDTFSDTVYEYKNDFYVSNVDSAVELHYELWSRNASVWLSVLNTSEDLVFIVTDSTYIQHGRNRYPMDLTVDFDQYADQLSRVPNFEDYDLGNVYPVMPGGWKGMLGPPLTLTTEELERIDPTETYDKSNSPLIFSVQTCFYRLPFALKPLCHRDSIWVQSVTPVDAGLLRSLEADPEFKKADKFYVTDVFWDP